MSTTSPHVSEDCQRCEDIEEWGAMPLHKEIELYDPEEICGDCEQAIREALIDSYESVKVDDEIALRRGN